MIKITRTERPSELTDEVQEKLTQIFIADNKKKVWDQKYIRDGLMEMSHCKCYYCEKKVGPGLTDMQVEHFKPKSLYPQEVVKWDNLLSACADCNRSKLGHDTGASPIVNPCEEDPRQFFYLKNFRYNAFDTDIKSKANVTIDVLGLNDLDKKCAVRYQIISAILDKLADICCYAKEHNAELGADVRKRNKVVKTCRGILKMCIPTAEYSAFAATAVQTNQDYLELKQILQNNNQWDQELEMLDKESQQCVYPEAKEQS